MPNPNQLDRVRTLAVCLWRIATGGLMLAVTAIALAQVFSRYILNASLIWAEELNRLLYVWLLLIAAAGTDHMRIGLIADKPAIARRLTLFGAICGALTLGFLMWGGWKLQAMFAFDRYVTLDLSKAWYFAAAILGGACWAAAMLWRALRQDDEGRPR